LHMLETLVEGDRSGDIFVCQWQDGL
jgi:hypothetical protein